jgi:hypothetical protein
MVNRRRRAATSAGVGAPRAAGAGILNVRGLLALDH